jgi:hypothetical protein
VRRETCLNCQIPGAGDADVQTLILISESVGGLVHHHHTIKCDGCGQWWFDDLVIGGLGIPVAARRDTELCGCPDDLPQYTRAAVMAPQPEDHCACTKAKCEEISLPLRLGLRSKQ